MIPFDELFKDGELTDYLNSKSKDLWKGTYFENYQLINNSSKGVFGEKLIEKFMPKLGCHIAKRKNRGHDIMIDGYKTEVKISLAQGLVENCFTLNHISFNKDWERLIFAGINYNLEDSKIIFLKKTELLSYMEENRDQHILNFQQGGKKIKNDDFFIMKNFAKFFDLPFVYNIYQWKEKADPKGVEFWLK